MSRREVYPNAPIVLVAVEVRHTQCEPLGRNQQSQMGAHFREILPLQDKATEKTIAYQVSPDGTQTRQETTTESPRWTSRDRRTALTMRSDAVVLETTDYGSYEKIRGILDIALRARADVDAPAGVERLGLRYIDEIRVPRQDSEHPDWEQWVDKSLLGPMHIGGELGLTPESGEGIAVFSGDSDSTLVLRYAAQDGYAVLSTTQLRRPLPPPGPFFKLDIDSFWQATAEVPEFVPALVLDRADALHNPVRSVFESLITERLREEVLRNG